MHMKISDSVCKDLKSFRNSLQFVMDIRKWLKSPPTALPPLKVPVGSMSLCMCACVSHGNAYPSVGCFKMQCLRDACGVTSSVLYSYHCFYVCGVGYRLPGHIAVGYV